MKAGDIGRSVFAFVKDPRRMGRLGLYIVLAFITFIFALQMTAPYDRAIHKGIEAVSESFDITYKDIDRGWVPGRVYINLLQIRTRPTKADEQPLIFTFNRVKVDVGLLALLGKNVSIDLDAEIGAGRSKTASPRSTGRSSRRVSTCRARATACSAMARRS
jgi:hypothetical protein